MPRRSRTHAHTLRKRSAPPTPAELRSAHERSIELTEDEEMHEHGTAGIAPIERRIPSVPYIRRESAGSAVRVGTGGASADQAATSRAARLVTTDYGYVISELKRIGLTGAGLVVLLVIIARFLH